MSGKWTVRETYTPLAKPGGSEPALLDGNPFSFRHGDELERDDSKTVNQEKDGVIIRQWLWLKGGRREGYVPHNPLDGNDIRSPAIPLVEGTPAPFTFSLFDKQISRETFAENCVRKAIRWQSNAAYLYAWAFIESGQDWPVDGVSSPGAKPGEQAVGTFGFLPATWRTLVDKLGSEQSIRAEDIEYPEAQVTFAASQSADAMVELATLLGRPPTYVDLYLAHLFSNQGCLEVRKAESQTPDKKADLLLTEIFASLDQATRAARINALMKRKASLIAIEGQPLSVKELVGKCVAELDRGFEHVKAVADAMIPAGQLQADKSVGIQSAGQDTLGILSEEFESNGNAAAIGFDSTGGWSYGKYQIASKKGRFQEFITSLAPDFAELKTLIERAGGDTAARAGTNDFKTFWRSLKGRADFVPAQHRYIRVSHYDKMVAALKNVIAVETRSNALQNVVWSVAVQHGPASDIVKICVANVGVNDDAKLIGRIYDERSKVNQYFASSTASVKQAVLNRFVQERKLALAMLAKES